MLQLCQACDVEFFNNQEIHVCGWAAPSGARSSEQKARYDLIPVRALEREAIRMAEGAAVHGERNYQQGVGDPVYMADRTNHLIEHALLYAAGDHSTDHLAAIRANAGILIWLEEQR